MIVSTLVLSIVGAIIIEKIIAPKLGKYRVKKQLNTLDDFEITYDGSKLSVDISEMWSDEGKNQSGCTISMSPKTSGLSDISIYSYYDIETEGDNAIGYVIPVNALDSREGRIVYYTRNGEKYHYSADCAGPNAEATTLHEAESYGLGPCGNCVN